MLVKQIKIKIKIKMKAGPARLNTGLEEIQTKHTKRKFDRKT